MEESRIPSVLKVMADYGCHPLWDLSQTGPGNVNPSDLPISPSLREDLSGWARSYDGTLNQGYPPGSGFDSREQHEEFVTVGLQLAIRLSEELGSQYLVLYFDDRTGKVVDVRDRERLIDGE